MADINPITVERGAGLTASGAIVTPTPIYGHFLTTNGMLLVSWAEWIQILGAIYVIYLLGKVANGVFQAVWYKVKQR